MAPGASNEETSSAPIGSDTAENTTGIPGGCLHRHRHRGGNPYHQIHIVGNKVLDDLSQHRGVSIAVVIRDLESYPFFLP